MRRIKTLKNVFMLIAIIAVGFIVAGCVPGGSSGPTAVNYHSGTSSLEMNLMKNMPPAEVWAGSDFIISAELKNRGAYNIEEGVLTLTNIPDQYVDAGDKQIPFTLEGRNPEYPEGGYEILSFKLKSKGLPEDKKELRIPFRLLAQYDYRTEASAKMCINPKIYEYEYEKSNTKACTPGDIEFKSGQGAPVTISKIEQLTKPFSDTQIEIGIKVTVANSGKGEIEDKVSIDEVALGYNYMACMPESFKIEKGKPATFTCNVVINKENGEYLSPLLILLDYSYVDYIDREFVVRRLESS